MIATGTKRRLRRVLSTLVAYIPFYVVWSTTTASVFVLLFWPWGSMIGEPVMLTRP